MRERENGEGGGGGRRGGFLGSRVKPIWGSRWLGSGLNSGLGIKDEVKSSAGFEPVKVRIKPHGQGASANIYRDRWNDDNSNNDDEYNKHGNKHSNNKTLINNNYVHCVDFMSL